MKKKLMLLFVLLALCLGVFGFSARAEGEVTDAKFFEFDAATGTIIKYSSDGPKDVVIPSEINGVAVRRIGDSAFAKNGLTGVKFPEGLTTIGGHAFYENQLTEVEFSEGLTSIGEYAFTSNQLTHAEFPEGLTTIGYAAFYYNKLNCVQFSENLQSIAEWAFRENKLTEVEVMKSCEVDPKAFDPGVNIIHPEGGKKPGDRFFTFDGATGTIIKYSLDGPKDVVIPAEIDGIPVRRIADHTFYEWDGLWGRNNIYGIRSVKFPDGVTFIGESAFHNNKLTKLKLPKNLEKIAMYAFSANQLTHVEFPEGLTEIWMGAFNRNLLTEVKLPEGLDTISGYVFSENRLTHVEFPKNLRIIRLKAFFSNHLKQVEFPDSLQKIEDEAFNYNQFTKVKVPEGCEVGPYAFDYGVNVLRKGSKQNNKEELFGEKIIFDPKYSWTVTFSGALDSSTVNAENFFIRDAEGTIFKGIEPTLIDAVKVRFVNNAAFEKNKDYYLVIKKDIRGKDSAKLKKDIIFKFRVE